MGAEARLVGLDPELEYHIAIESCTSRASSAKVVLPQRARPANWSPHDVLIWCQAQHVPELVHMTQQYAIDGSTLLSMGEDDLKASGLQAPFLLRRTLAPGSASRCWLLDLA